MKEQQSHPQRSRRIWGAVYLALAIVATFSAGIIPSCAGGFCCPVTPDAPTVRTQMPCCDVQPSIIASPDAIRLQQATFAGFTDPPQKWAPVTLVTTSGAPELSFRVQATLATVSKAHDEPPPPLYLLNAQILI